MRNKKTYSEVLNHLYDAPACDAVMHYLELQGLISARNPDKYGVDILVYAGYKPIYAIEVEVRRGWRGSVFPRAWNPVHILERKIPLFTQKKLGTDLYIVSECLTRGLIVPQESIVRAYGRGLHEISNSEVEKGEMFLEVPVNECVDIELLGGSI